MAASETGPGSSWIADDRIRAVLAEDVLVWEFACENPNMDVMHHPEDPVWIVEATFGINSLAPRR
jgi:hypothetical protein